MYVIRLPDTHSDDNHQIIGDSGDSFLGLIMERIQKTRLDLRFQPVLIGLSDNISD